MRLTLEGNNEPPEGVVLNAEISSVKEVEKPWIDDRTGEKARRIAFEFTLLDDEWAGRKKWADLFPSFYNSPKCKLYDWTLKVLNRDELPEGFTLDTSAFEGARVPIKLETRHYTKRNGEPGSSQDVILLSQTEAQGLRSAGADTGVQSNVSTQQPDIEPIKGLDDSADDDLVEPF